MKRRPEETRRDVVPELAVGPVAPGHAPAVPGCPPYPWLEWESEEWRDEITGYWGQAEDETGLADWATAEDGTGVSETPTGHPALGRKAVAEPREEEPEAERLT